MKYRVSVLLLGAICALINVPVANGGFIIDVTANVTQNPSTGSFGYEYLVSNPIGNADDGDPDLVFDFSVNVAADAKLIQIVAPLGWDTAYSSGQSLIEWTASDVSFVLAPGSSLTFGFVSAFFGPGDQDYTALALNQQGTNVDLAAGVTTGPLVSAVVPEPSSLALSVIGLFGALLYHSRRSSSTLQR